jgi:aromatic-L-amino-acid/L-tryptophan decarboxylase
MNLIELEDSLSQLINVLKLDTDEYNNHSQPILKEARPSFIRNAINEKVPTDPMSSDQLLHDFKTRILPYVNRNTNPRFGGYITGAGNNAAVLAEFIKAYFNQNSLKWNCSPISCELEQLVISWISEFLILPEFKFGLLTSGGSMSNFLAIFYALMKRNIDIENAGLYDQKRKIVYCSNQTHNSIERGMVFLGLGLSNLRKIDVERDFRIKPIDLERKIESDKEAGFDPLMIIGNAGTTNTGSIDNLKELSTIAQRHKLWLHVDGAYGLPARRIPELTHMFDGVDMADSLSINPHKWMYVPFEAGCLLLKEEPFTHQNIPDYLFTQNPGTRWESSQYSIELTKEFRALKIWFTLKYYGSGILTDWIKHDIELANMLAEKLAQLPMIKVEKFHPLSIVCFRYEDPECSIERNEHVNIETIRNIESKGVIFLTGTKLHNRTYLRVFYGNQKRNVEDVDHMILEINNTFNEMVEST